jgi:hypothetical protein
MARRVFHSFHFKADAHRVSQVRNMGVIEGQQLLSGNDWEAVKKRGNTAITNWIATQMKGRSCVVVLIGSATAGRKWVEHEIVKGWNDGKGVVGVHVHRLKNLDGKQSPKGTNPFATITVGDTKMSSIVKTYDPPYADSKQAYDHIKKNLETWVDEAIRIRKAG